MVFLDPDSPLAHQAAEDARVLFAARRGASAVEIRDQRSWDQLTSEVVENILGGLSMPPATADELGVRLGIYLGAWSFFAESLLQDAVTLGSRFGPLDPTDQTFGQEWTRRLDAVVQHTLAWLATEGRTIV